MSRSWKRFLLIRFPLAIIVVGAVCQLAGYLVSSLPMRRNRIDEMALAVVNDHQPHRIVLLGDSIIRDATQNYGVGSLSDVVNLTTQGYVGLPGDMFLLRRYLENHPPPKHVVIAAAPDDYSVHVDPRMVHYYMWNTFSRPDERAFLKTYMPSIDAREKYPAVMDLQERILERLIALTKKTPAHFNPPPPLPDPHAPVEPVTDNLASDNTANLRLHSLDLSLAPVYRASLAGMCQLGRRYGFVLDIVWAPMPPIVEQGHVASGQLAALDKQVKDVFAHNGCESGPIFNMNDVQTFTNFDNGAFHLRGEGWQERAALILQQYLAALPDRSQTQPALLKASGTVSAEARLDAER